ncbi:MAG: tetratricopeptide repeat protein [Aureispira sp.]
MGFLDFLFGKKKDKNIQVQQAEDDPNHVQVYAKASDGTSEGISVEKMVALNAQTQEVIDSNDLGQISNYNTQLMGAQKYEEMIAFNQQVIDKYPNTNAVGNGHNFIGVAYFFKKDYQQAIAHYRLATKHGMDMGMMDDNIWEATELLYKQTGDGAHIEAYKINSPNGAYLKKANKLLK